MRHRPIRIVFSSLSIVVFAACSGSDGGDSLGFQLTGVSFRDGNVLKVNQEIVLSFSEPVDFSSVSLNTVSIQTSSGAPATGTFSLRGTNQVVFQPNCPSQDSLNDTGLMPGGEAYLLRVLGRSSGAGNTVRSTLGAPLEVTQFRSFSTAETDEAFLDTAQGPPVPVVRNAGSSDVNATYLEIGGDPDNRVYFERDANQDLVLSVPGFEVPLNLFAEPSSRVAVVVEFNQALNPLSTNVQPALRLEFLDGLVWRALETEVALVQNCTETGARVRLDPVGILPQGTQIRAVVLSGLQDLVGDPTLGTEAGFAVAPTESKPFSIPPADLKSDEFNESFMFGGDAAMSFQDLDADFDVPHATWGGGRLVAAFEIDGGGGPGGAFDWVVAEGEPFVLDTDGGLVLAADGTTTQVVEGGVLDLRHMTIEEGAEVRVQGSRPLRINATGTVTIRGTLDVSGFSAKDIDRLNTGNMVEHGGEGGPGGGGGGDANEVVANSTPVGGFGDGPLGGGNSGGGGGESGYAPTAASSRDSRRPGGGAGGRFAPDGGPGLIAEAGLDGSKASKGALTNASPAAGGALSPGAFVVGDGTDDFFGTRALGTPGNVTSSIRGELAGLWGGYGGGGGGNALPAGAFPTPNWTPASDEKGGAGGGGGGGLHIRALGPIQFGAQGLIRCDGGRGAVGENVLQQDHIGGNGGSGSGGHVVLETASFLDFTDGGAAVGALSRDWISARGGATITGASTTAGQVSFGGAGGPGLVQLHAPDSLTPPSSSSATSRLVVPAAAAGAVNPLDEISSPAGIALVPSFGAHSRARSKWISIGAADRKPGGATALLQFLFLGLNTTAGADEGKVLVSGESVPDLPALLDEALEGNPDVVVLGDRLTLSVEGGSLAPFMTPTLDGISNDLYLRTPSLLTDFTLRLLAGTAAQDFQVSDAQYDEGGAGAGDERLSLTVADSGTDLQDFIDANTALGVVQYQLIPRFFRLMNGGNENSLPSDGFVRVLFQAADDDGNGAPDEANPLVDWTGNISEFNALLPGEIQFFRFEVEFELNATGGAVTADTLPVSLDFLRIPFVF